MHDCPGGCGRSIPGDKFFCNLCSDAVPDARIVKIGEALDRNDTVAAEEQIALAVADLT